MTNDKINIQEIVDLISARLSISKKLIEEFFRVLLPIIEDTLKAGEPVKIKNFGTLKIQWNNPRKSINVNTGEEIIIEGYNKIVFVPEESLKELVNEPLAHLFPIELDETQTEQIPENSPLRIINEQALEIKNILSEINQLNKKNDIKSEIDTLPVDINDIDNTVDSDLGKINLSETNVLANAEIKSINSEASENAVEVEFLPIADAVEETIEQHEVLSQKHIEQEQSQLNQSQPDQVENQVEESSNVKSDNIITLITSKQEPIDIPKHKINIWWIAVPSVMVAAIVFLYCFNLDIYKFVNSKIESFMPEQKVAHNVIILPEDSTKSNQITIVKSPDDLFYENLLNKNRKYEVLFTIERLTGDRTIYSLSEKYYGHSAFWIYIYDANKKEIPDIWNIKRGTPLKIPVLDSMLIDTRNPRTFEIARNLLKTLTENKVSELVDNNKKNIKDSSKILGRNDSAKSKLTQDIKTPIKSQTLELKNEAAKPQQVITNKETVKIQTVETKKESPKKQTLVVKKETTKPQQVITNKETGKIQTVETKKESPKKQTLEVKKETTKPQQVITNKETGKNQIVETKKESPKQQIVDVKKETVKPQPIEVKKEYLPVQNTLLATETMQEGSRLTIYARKYYGSKYFWVYIYEANKDVIKNPDNVPVGTKIKIPKLDSKLIDLNNPESITKAKELEKKYLGK
jgi:nucleoid DNA-binding protein/nucleoid-associated protein YgaU